MDVRNCFLVWDNYCSIGHDDVMCHCLWLRTYVHRPLYVFIIRLIYVCVFVLSLRYAATAPVTFPSLESSLRRWVRSKSPRTLEAALNFTQVFGKPQATPKVSHAAARHHLLANLRSGILRPGRHWGDHVNFIEIDFRLLSYV